MLYYRVKPEFDQRRKKNDPHGCDFYISNELYTAKEVEKQGLNLNFLEPVQISKQKTFFCFGARFESTIK